MFCGIHSNNNLLLWLCILSNNLAFMWTSIIRYDRMWNAFVARIKILLAFSYHHEFMLNITLNFCKL